MPTPTRQASRGSVRSADRHGSGATGTTATTRGFGLSIDPSRPLPMNQPLSSPLTALTPSSTTTMAILDLPGHSLYLSDPHRLSVLSLTIDATTRLTRLDSPLSSLRTAHGGTTSDGAAGAVSPPASAQRAGPPNSSRRISYNVSSKRSTLAAPEEPGRAGQLRPRSAEIGWKAREAFNELGRRAREVAGSLDRSPHVDALNHVTQHLSPELGRARLGASHDAKDARRRPQAAESLADNRSSSGNCVRVQRRITAKPQSLTFGRDSRLTSCIIPLDLDARCTALTEYDGNDDYLGRPSNENPRTQGQVPELIAFVSDPTSRPIAPFGDSSAAGSESGEDTAPPSVQAHGPDRVPFDPTRLLLKVEPPLEQARHLCASQWPIGASPDPREESHSVDLRFRLRLCASASAGPSAGSSGQTANRQASAASRSASMVASDRGLEEVLFLSADSSQKLVDAIDMASSALLSKEAAALEGLARVVVNPAPVQGSVARGARDCDFEWQWKPLRRSAQGAAFNEKGPGTGKCCCAFVELDASRSKARILAAFQFWVEIPPPSVEAISQASHWRPAELLRSDSVALVAALNRDIDRADLFDSRTISAHGMFATTADSALAISSTGSEVPRLQVDHTEISLEDVDNDSPILRAAIANLDRRTTTFKRVAKAALKAANEVRLRILGVMEAENVLDEALRDLSSLAPETLLKLRHDFGDKARECLTRHRREQATMLEQNVERPLIQIVEQCRTTLEQIKSFESESKSYYSHMQKWLSSRIVPDGGAGPSGFNGLSHSSVNSADKVLKQERADEKQKLRQLRFDSARLDLYTALVKLHGGQVELELAGCMLRLAQWQATAPSTVWGSEWPGFESTKSMLALTAGVDATHLEQGRNAELIRERCNVLNERIRSVETSLKKAGEQELTMVNLAMDDSDLTADTTNVTEPSHEFDAGPNAKGARQAGHKIRNFFGGLSLGKQGSPVPTRSPASQQEWTASSASTARSTGPLEQSFGSDIKRKVSYKLKATRGVTGGIAANSPRVSPPAEPARLQDGQPVGSSHPLPGQQDAEEAGTDVRSRRAVELAQSPLIEPSSGAMTHALIFDAASSRIQSAPQTGQDASAISAVGSEATSALGQNDSATARPNTSASGLGIGGFSLDGSVPTSSAASEAAIRLPARGAPPGQERKKEGVLWVMSKPVTGPAGSDAPRAVNRAGHWRECWVVLSGSGHIGEYADWKHAKILEPSNPLIDLRFATVREARGVDRRFAFEVVTRDNRRFFQAPDEASMRDWTKAIAKAIESLLNGTSSVRKLDRAVRATPFEKDAALQAGGVVEEGSIDDFGASSARKGLEDPAQRPFSQSMTDLAGEGKERPRTFDNDVSATSRRGGGHLYTLSESYTSAASRPGGKEEKAKRSTSKHERGISNKTPIFGYLNGNGSELGLTISDNGHGHPRSANISDGLPGSSGEANSEFDRRIEEIVQSSFGKSSSIDSPSREAPAFPMVSEMGRLQSHAKGPSEHASTTSTRMSRATEIIEISRRPENSTCADCRSQDPRWASWALGNQPCCIFICISCSGVHRSLGVHLSRVKSVDLDDWTEEQVEAARRWGNAKANELWEFSKPSGLFPAPGDRQKFWKMKYTDAIWKKPNALVENPSKTSRALASAAGEQKFEQARNDSTPTKLSRLRSASGDQARLGRGRPSTDATSDGNGSSLSQTSPRPGGPRPLLPSRSSSFMEFPTSTSPDSPTQPLPRPRKASESSRIPTKAAAPQYTGFASRPGFSRSARSESRDGSRWSAGPPPPIDAGATQPFDNRPTSFFVNDLTSTSPTTYESAAQAYRPSDVQMALTDDEAY